MCNISFINKLSIKLIVLLMAISISQFSYAQGTSLDNARFISQSVPDNVASGQTYTFVVTYENNGTLSWTPNDYRLKILSIDAKAFNVWGIDEIPLAQVVEVGHSISFEIKITAPTTEGTYQFQTQMSRTGNYFGEPSKRLDLVVAFGQTTSEIVNSAAFVEQSVPKAMETGKQYKVMIAMSNTGKTSWTPGSYRLVLLDPSGDRIGNSVLWSTSSIELSETIAPGSSKVFNFELTPYVAGTYTLQWRMSSSNGGLFGDASNPETVTVLNIEPKKNMGKKGNE
jgi:hypothetical protein